MPDLPININSVPAHTASKQPGNSDAAQQEVQEFGNVLARQVADAEKSAESNPASSGKLPKQAAEQANTDTAPVTDSAGLLPADILAALLTQPNQAVTPQPGINAQPDISSQTGVTTQPDIALQATGNTIFVLAAAATAKEANAMAAPALISGNGQPSNISIPESDTAHPQIESTIKDSKGFADTFKATGMKEISSSASDQPWRGSLIREIPASPQQAGIPPLVPAATPPSNPTGISATVTQPAWGDEFSQKITWMATQLNQRAELHLNPPQLGPLDVVLKINGDQATALFTSPHAAVRDAIEQALPKLREMLADNGITLGNAMVSDQTAKNNQDNSSRKAPEKTAASASDGVTEAAGTQEARGSSRSRHNGMVDTFA